MQLVALHGWREALGLLAWGVALLWLVRTRALVEGMPSVADLTDDVWDASPEQKPLLAVIVPAKEEEASLRATLEALAEQDYARLRVIVIDDRSSDGTGAIADAFAERMPELFEAVHITELPEGWLGKTWALEVGCERSREADFWLFTDADVLMSPSILRRSLAYMETEDADHLVVLPTPLVRSRGEGILLGFFQVMGSWFLRPWRVADSKARYDAAGVGAFNMVRRSALEELGGWLPQRMVVLEDITLGRRMKASGMRQRVAFAPERVLVHWAAGMSGVVGVTTKNLFSAVNFRAFLMLAVCAWMTVFLLAPAVGLFWWVTLLPCALVMLCVFVTYRELGAASAIDPRFWWAYPVGAVVMLWAMLRSMMVALWRRGVIWRGTFYPLHELRQQNSPFRWEREAMELRDRSRRERPSRLRRFVDALRGRRNL